MSPWRRRRKNHRLRHRVATRSTGHRNRMAERERERERIQRARDEALAEILGDDFIRTYRRISEETDHA